MFKNLLIIILDGNFFAAPKFAVALSSATSQNVDP